MLELRAPKTPFYLLLTAAVFFLEIGIALFVHDAWMRPHGGDLLVALLIYFFVRALTRAPPLAAALLVGAFCFAIEGAQFYGLAKALGLSSSGVASLVLGRTFDPLDLWMYAIGSALACIIDLVLLLPLLQRVAEGPPNPAT